jgi:hypothetical protein
MVSGVAALMAAENPKLIAVDLRARRMQKAQRTNHPGTSGYVDALRAVLAASSAVGYDTTQAPQLKVLSATRSGHTITVQAASVGSTVAIQRYVVMLNGRTAAQLHVLPSPFTVTLHKLGRRVRVVALTASGHVLASGQAPVVKLRNGKLGAGSGTKIGP